MTSRPCSAASLAVISDPLFSAASITTTALESPLMIRLRRGKVRHLGWRPRTKLRKKQARLFDSLRQRPVLGGVHKVDAGAQYGHGGATGGERRRVRGRVDATRQPADHDDPRASEIGRDLRRKRQPGARRGPRADHGRPLTQ